MTVLTAFTEIASFMRGAFLFFWKRLVKFLGISNSEEEQARWKAIFERKILKGNVGIQFRWPRSSMSDFLWEFETVVTSLVQPLPEEQNTSLEVDLDDTQDMDGPAFYSQASTMTQNRNRNNYPMGNPLQRKPTLFSNRRENLHDLDTFRCEPFPKLSDSQLQENPFDLDLEHLFDTLDPSAKNKNVDLENLLKDLEGDDLYSADYAPLRACISLPDLTEDDALEKRYSTPNASCPGSMSKPACDLEGMKETTAFFRSKSETSLELLSPSLVDGSLDQWPHDICYIQDECKKERGHGEHYGGENLEMEYHDWNSNWPIGTDSESDSKKQNSEKGQSKPTRIEMTDLKMPTTSKIAGSSSSPADPELSALSDDTAWIFSSTTTASSSTTKRSDSTFLSSLFASSVATSFQDGDVDAPSFLRKHGETSHSGLFSKSARMMLSLARMFAGAKLNPDTYRRCPIEDCEVPDCLINEMASKARNPDLPGPILSKRFSNRLLGPIQRLQYDIACLSNRDEDFEIIIPVNKARLVDTDISEEGREKATYQDETTEKAPSETLSCLRFHVGPPDKAFEDESTMDTIARNLNMQPLKLPVLNKCAFDVNEAVRTNSMETILSAKIRRSAAQSRRRPFFVRPVGVFKSAFFKRKFLKEELALKFYDLLTLTEAKNRVDALSRRRDQLESIYMWKHETLKEVVKIARNYYSEPTDTNRTRWKKLKSKISEEHKSDTDIKVIWSSLPDHLPIVTVSMIVWQMLVLVALTYMYGITETGVKTLEISRNDVPTFGGKQKLTRLIEPNPWIGPPPKAFIEIGGAFRACVWQGDYLKRLEENVGLETAYWDTIPLQNVHLGCCYTTDEYPIMGTLSRVNCLLYVCKLTGTTHIFAGGKKHWLPSDDIAWQWWRFVLSLPHTHGFIQFGAIMVLELVTMVPMEASAGWHRVLVIYVISSWAGIMLACVTESELAHEGSVPGVMGILGGTSLEIVQAWQFLNKPKLEVAKVFFSFGFFLIMGTFYFASLSATVIGYFVGIFASVFVLPYIGIGQAFNCTRWQLVILGGLILFIIVLVLQNWVANVARFGKCTKCFPLECVPYTSSMCRTY